MIFNWTIWYTLTIVKASDYIGISPMLGLNLRLVFMLGYFMLLDIYIWLVYKM